MMWVARLLRFGLVAACLTVLSGIVPISLKHFQTGNACPNFGPIPACYVVSIAYASMAVAALIFWRQTLWLFLVGAVPVIALAAAGTSMELIGYPTCPRSNGGWPLCYSSLMIGLVLLLVFFLVRGIEQNRSRATTGT